MTWVARVASAVGRAVMALAGRGTIAQTTSGPAPNTGPRLRQCGAQSSTLSARRESLILQIAHRKIHHRETCFLKSRLRAVTAAMLRGELGYD